MPTALFGRLARTGLSVLMAVGCLGLVGLLVARYANADASKPATGPAPAAASISQP